MTSFESLGLSERALKAVELLGYSEPTPVQQRAIPVVAEGRDIIAAAKTGTGKTAAFSLPLLDRVEFSQRNQGPKVLVVTPTRELAEQIAQVCSTIAQATHHRIACVVGGLSYKPQIAALKRGVDVLIATPGRLIDLMDQKAVRLGNLEALVLDEADRMLDMGFWPSIKRIVAASPTSRQTLLFSATIDDAVNRHAASLLTKPKRIEVAHRGDVADTIDQYLVRLPKLARPEALYALLNEKGAHRVMVFTRTKRGADTVCRRLRKAGYSAEPIHADRSQNARKRTLERFSNDEIDIVVATDVLARGIDVSQVAYVVNYDLPSPAESYVHRIGRTGRAGETGFAVSFVTPETESELAAIEKLIKQQIPLMELKGFTEQDAQLKAAEKQAKQEAKTDPEIVQARKELASKARKKRKKAARNEPTPSNRSSAQPSTSKRAKAKRREQIDVAETAAQQTGKRTEAAKKRSKRTPQAAQTRHRTPKRATTKKGDFRPGRAHRADVARKRTGKRN